MNREREQLQDKVKQIEERTQQLQDQIKQVKEDKVQEEVQLHGQIKHLKEEKVQLQDKVKQIEEGNVQLRDKIKQVKEDKKQEQVQLHGQIKHLKEEKEQLQDRVKQIEEQNEQLQDRIKQVKEDKKQEQVQLHGPIKHLKEEKEQLQNQLKQMKEETFQVLKSCDTETRIEMYKTALEFIVEALEQPDQRKMVLTLEKPLNELQRNKSRQSVKIPITSQPCHETIARHLATLFQMECKLGKEDESPSVISKTPWSKISPRAITSLALSAAQTRKIQGGGWLMLVFGLEEHGAEPGQFHNPNGLLWDEEKLLVCDTDNNRIQILNKRNTVLRYIRFDDLKHPFKPYSIALSRHGKHYYITDIGNNHIIICEKKGEIVKTIDTKDVRSIAFSGDFYFVIHKKNKSLCKYTIEEGKLVNTVTGTFLKPYCVVATEDNRLLVSDKASNNVQIFDQDLNCLNPYCTKGSQDGQVQTPRGMATDSDGNVYISDWGNKRVVKLKSDGQFDSNLFVNDILCPNRIAVSDNGAMIAVTQKKKWFEGSDHQIRIFLDLV